MIWHGIDPLHWLKFVLCWENEDDNKKVIGSSVVFTVFTVSCADPALRPLDYVPYFKKMLDQQIAAHWPPAALHNCAAVRSYDPKHGADQLNFYTWI